MELPSFYKTFAKNILRHTTGRLAGEQVAGQKSLTLPILFAAVIALLVASPGYAAGIYSHLQLKQDVASFLADAYRNVPNERIDISVGNLDNRLRLGQCPEPVEFTPQDQTGLGGNITVKAQCASTIKWVVHIPAQVMIYQTIPVAAQDIARGQRITAAHLNVASVNVSTLRQSFAGDEQAIVGREARRNIGKGEVFRTALLDAPTTVKRGEVVVVESVVGSIKVSSSGTAMTDGRLGQKIRVRNASSERIVMGVVRAQGVVQTL